MTKPNNWLMINKKLMINLDYIYRIEYSENENGESEVKFFSEDTKKEIYGGRAKKVWNYLVASSGRMENQFS